MGSIYRLCICFLCLFGVVFGNYNWGSNPGDGTEGNPYQISTAEQLISIGSDAVLLDKNFILTADIDMSAYPLANSPIAPDTDQDNSYTDENRFGGSLDGRGHRICNLTIARPGTSYNIGLIGLTTSVGTSWEVKNIGLEEVNISVGNSSQHIGGLIARGYGGTVSDCYVTGSVSSGTNSYKMGGLMSFASSCNISNCYAMCTVTNETGSSYTGGAIGHLTYNSLLDKCYSTGIVDSGSTASSIGALVGTLYNASVNSCYYLNAAGGNNTIGISRTDAQLKLIDTSVQTYTGWEFGNSGHWRMRDDVPDYPYLSWEFKETDFYGDFETNLQDFAIFSQSWQTSSGSFDFNYLCDINGNGVVDPNDLRVLCEDWLEN